jgi:hypothetical protein
MTVAPAPKRNVLFYGTAVLIRQCYLSFKIRIRQWGGLPARRGPTILITNHQFMDEGEIVTSRTFLRHPWIMQIMVNARRTFETGFFAERLPWTAPFLRRYNASGLWESFGILPVENHLFSRTLLTLAEEIRAVHGDLALEDVLPAERVAELRLAGRRLSDLWSMRSFAKAQTRVKLSQLREPYRREAIERGRATTTADIARIVETVRGGATFYVTPEGDFSRDGSMHRMRGGITEALLPVGEPWLCAIAYDPFRGRRLGMLYRILRPADANDLGTSLGAARPVTTSAVLATVLLELGAWFTRDDVVAAAVARLATIPARAFVDPELRANPPRVIDEAFANLEHRGTLRRAGDGYTLTEQRGDPRFPHIADMLSYQRTMLAETLACNARLDQT